MSSLVLHVLNSPHIQKCQKNGCCRPLVTVRNEVAKVRLCFYRRVSVHGGGGGLPQCMLGYHIPRKQTPQGADPPPRERQPLLRTIRILLECILVIPNVSPVSSLMSSLCCPWCYPNVVRILSPHSCHPRLTRFHETLQDFARIFFHLKIKAVYNNSAKTDKGSHH